MKNKGFTMVELLGAIVILAVISVIAIASITGLTDKAKQEENTQYEENLRIAAESYMQANKSKLPKDIGSSVSVTSTDLKNKKYLKEDKGGCVKVKKSNNSKFEYEVDMNCTPDAECTDEEKPSVVELYITDETNQKVDLATFDDFENAYLFIQLSGGTKNGQKIAIDGYNYIIYVKTETDSNLHEAFNSGTLSANGEFDMKVKRKISEYIDVAGVTYIDATVSITNANGCTNSDSDDASTPDQIQDQINPTCPTPPEEPENWINKDSAEKYRTISIDCDDGTGSGCVRPKFARTWPNDDQKDAEWAYIQVVDNAGNTNRTNETPTWDQLNPKGTLCNLDKVTGEKGCMVRVNVDKTLPTIKILGATAATEDGKKGTTNIYNGSLTEINDSTSSRSGNIGISDHKNLVNNWMNKKNYPYGVIYEIEISDNIHLDSWTWETNPAYLTVANNTNYSASNDRYAYEDTSKEEYWKSNCGLKKKVILIGFNQEGRRTGRLTVKDKAGNKTTLYISANLDRTPPPIPEVSYNNYNPNAENKWSRIQNAEAYVKQENQKDNLADAGHKTLSDVLSGWKRFEYEVENLYDSSKNKSGITGDKVIFDKSLEGKNKVAFRSIDQAENESNYSTLTDVWVDYTPPKCDVSRTVSGTEKNGWVGLVSKTNNAYETVTIKAVCNESTTDNAGNINSGCVGTTSYQTIYGADDGFKKEFKTTEAGARGIKNGGVFYDKAGNSVTCEANKKVYSDYHRPSCTVTGESTSWRKEGTTITRECRDTAGTINSGCEKTIYQKGVYNTEGKTYTTENYPLVTISDNAGNELDCAARTMNIYVDKQKPSCSGSKSNQNTTAGVTIKYTCGDHGGSGVVNCPGKQTKIKSTQSHTVKDKVGNKMTCTVSVSSYNQYKYIKKNVVATCKDAKCCGYKKCMNCNYCGVKRYEYNWTSCYWTKCSVQSPPRTSSCGRGTYGKWLTRSVNNCGTSGSNWQKRLCYCKQTPDICKDCRNKSCGAETCTKTCCGYKCGSQWTDWGAASTGCKSDSRKLYK